MNTVKLPRAEWELLESWISDMIAFGHFIPPFLDNIFTDISNQLDNQEY